MSEEKPPEPRVHKKVAHIEFMDLKVHLESEDEYVIGALNQLAIDDMALLIRQRAAFDAEEAEPGGEKPDNEIKPLSVEHKTEIAKMYQ